jgi:hypothetical protein
MIHPRQPSYNYGVLRPTLMAVILFVALMPPGLCPCWLMHDVRAFHPHPGGFPERPHRHDYLFDIFQSQQAADMEIMPNPVGMLIEKLLNGSVWQARDMFKVSALNWQSAPPTPPPRLLAS